MPHHFGYMPLDADLCCLHVTGTCNAWSRTEQCLSHAVPKMGIPPENGNASVLACQQHAVCISTVALRGGFAGEHAGKPVD